MTVCHSLYLVCRPDLLPSMQKKSRYLFTYASNFLNTDQNFHPQALDSKKFLFNYSCAVQTLLHGKNCLCHSEGY